MHHNIIIILLVPIVVAKFRHNRILLLALYRQYRWSSYQVHSLTDNYNVSWIVSKRDQAYVDMHIGNDMSVSLNWIISCNPNLEFVNIFIPQAQLHAQLQKLGVTRCINAGLHIVYRKFIVVPEIWVYILWADQSLCWEKLYACIVVYFVILVLKEAIAQTYTWYTT